MTFATVETIQGALVARTYSRREALRLSTGLGMFTAASYLGIACGGGSGGRSTASPPGTTLREDAPSGDRSGRLRLGVVAKDGLAIQPLSELEHLLAYSRLVAVDPRDAQVHGDLATSFEVVEPLEVRFTLRPDVFLHPDVDDLAVPITAELIKRDFEERAAGGAYLFSEVIDQIDVPDNTTIILKLRAPFSLLFELLGAADSGIRGEGRYAAFAERVGSGPFMPAGQDSTGHALVANPRYHEAGYPRLERVNVLHFATQVELDAAFLASELDVLHHPTTNGQLGVIERPGAQQLIRAGRSLRGLGLSLLPSKGGVPTAYVEAFQDERVRRAISVALDRDALATIDESIVASPVGPAFRADSLSATELEAHPLYRHDAAEAAKLLQAATSDEVRFRILTTDAAGPRDYTALVASQLRDVGFRAELRQEDHETWNTAFFAGNFEATLFQLGRIDSPGIGLRLHTTGGLDGRFSLWGYSNPVFDAATTTALSQVIPVYRANAVRQAQRVLLQDTPGMLPLTAPIEVASVGARVSGYAFDAFDFNAAWLAPEWERPA